MSSINRPLSGVIVVELATFVAAPSAGRLLADWGANVIKIEPPKGDPLRILGALVNMPTDNEKENPAYDLQNSNKKGIVLNLKDPQGMKAMHKLLDKADIFLTNNRQDSLVKMGLNYEHLHEQYPALVYGHVLGYGEQGPDKDRAGFDFTAYYARGGVSGTLYEKGSYPMPTVAAFGDSQVGTALAGGLCAALYGVKQSGVGEKVSVSLLHTAVYALGHMIISSQYGNPYPRSRMETANPLQAAYQAKDERWIQCSLHAYDQDYGRFCHLIGHPELAEDTRFNKFEKVKDTPQELITTLDEIFKERNVDEWVEIFKTADMACDKMMLWEEILEDPQAWEDQMLCKVSGYGDDNGQRIQVRSPVKFRQSGVAEFGKGPKIGEDTADVLTKLGYSQMEIEEMYAAGSVK